MGLRADALGRLKQSLIHMPLTILSGLEFVNASSFSSTTIAPILSGGLLQTAFACCGLLSFVTAIHATSRPAFTNSPPLSIKESATSILGPWDLIYSAFSRSYTVIFPRSTAFPMPSVERGSLQLRSHPKKRIRMGIVIEAQTFSTPEILRSSGDFHLRLAQKVL